MAASSQGLPQNNGCLKQRLPSGAPWEFPIQDKQFSWVQGWGRDAGTGTCIGHPGNSSEQWVLRTPDF